MLLDSLQKQEYRYEFYLCRSYSPYEIIACLSECSFNRNIKYQLANVDELEMEISRVYTDLTLNETFDTIQVTNIIRVETYIDDTLQKTQLFHIAEVETISGDKDTKVIKAYSLQYRMNKIKVRDFTDTTYLYTGNPYDIEHPENSGIMDYILELLENTWSVSYVSSGLNTARTYDISESTILEAIKTIESNYNAIFFYNTENQTIQIKSYDELSGESGIILSNENYVKQYKENFKLDEIYTRLYIQGSGTNSTGIRSVNILGTDYIDNFTFFMTTEYMSQDLIDALTTLNALRVSSTSIYTGYLATLTTKQNELAILEDELYDLTTQLHIYQDAEDGAIKLGIYGGQNYTYWHNLVSTQEGLITTKQGQITTKNNEIAVVQNNINNLIASVSYETNLSLAERQELLLFINEKTQKFDTGDANVLLSLGQQLLSIISTAQYDIELDVIDLYSAQSESYNWNKIQLGFTVSLMIPDLNIELTPRITMISHSYDKHQLNITVSNKAYLNGDLEYVSAIFAQSKQSSTILNNEKEIYKEFDTVKDTVIYNNTPINTTNNIINVGATDLDTLANNVQINRRGMYLKALTPDGLAEDPGQMRITGNQILFTKDKWTTYSMAITPSGINTDQKFTLFSQGSYNGNSYLTIDGTGIQLHGVDSSTGIQIFNKLDQKVFNLDSNGNIVMAGGTLTITTGLPTNQLTDGSKFLRDDTAYNEVRINSSKGIEILKKDGLATKGTVTLNATTGLEIKDKDDTSVFYLDTNGNIVMAGSLTSGSTITGAAINGGTITIGSNNNVFKADINGIYLGNATFANAPFRVTPTGVLYATNANITGTITGSTIQTLIDNKKMGFYANGTNGDIKFYYNDDELLQFYNDGSGYVFRVPDDKYLQLGTFASSYKGSLDIYNVNDIIFGHKNSITHAVTEVCKMSEYSGGMAIYSKDNVNNVYNSNLQFANKKTFGSYAWEFNDIENESKIDRNTIIVRRDNQGSSGGTSGYVNSGLYVIDVARDGINTFEWAIIGSLHNYASAGENVGVYGQGNKYNTGLTWGGVFEARDKRTNPILNADDHGLVGLEVDIFADGDGDTDNTENEGDYSFDGVQKRHIIDVVYGKNDPSGHPVKVSNGIRIGAVFGDSSQGSLNAGLRVNDKADTALFINNTGVWGYYSTGNHAVGIDLTQATHTTEQAIRIKADDYLAFEGTGAIKMKYNPNNGYLEFYNGATRVGYINMNGVDHAL